MARKLRVQYPGAIYHVMNRGDHLEVIFRDGQDPPTVSTNTRRGLYPSRLAGPLLLPDEQPFSPGNRDTSRQPGRGHEMATGQTSLENCETARVRFRSSSGTLAAGWWMSET